MKRTPTQNNSLHEVLGEFADDMNEAGYDFKTVVRLPVSFTRENIKEYMFHPIMKLMYPEIDSTKDLSTTQMQKVYEIFNAAMAEKFGISKDWPTRFNR